MILLEVIAVLLPSFRNSPQVVAEMTIPKGTTIFEVLLLHNLFVHLVQILMLENLFYMADILSRLNLKIITSFYLGLFKTLIFSAEIIKFGLMMSASYILFFDNKKSHYIIQLLNKVPNYC